MFSRSVNKQLLTIASVGTIGAVGLSYYYTAVRPISNENGKTFTNPNDWIDLKVKSTVNLGQSSKKLIFELSNPDDVSGLVDCSCLLTKFVTAKGNNVIRPYTPTNDPNEKGVIELIVKKYEGGKMSSHIHDLKPNDTLSFKGPIVKWKWEPNQYKSVALIGGGTGITPLYRLISRIAENPDDNTKVELFYGSVSAEDILMKKELDDLAEKHKDQFKVTYFLDKPPSAWKGETGVISKEFLKKSLPAPSKDSKIFICGPPGMYKAISGMKNSPTDQGEVTGALADLGYTKEHVYKF